MVSEDLVHAVGEVTVEASCLEHCVSVLVSRANGDIDEGARKILSRVGGPLRDLLKLLEHVEAEQTLVRFLSPFRDFIDKYVPDVVFVRTVPAHIHESAKT